ncbi:MAG: tetratricopeptide repeat protein [Leadbetterella sp.]
MEKNEDKSYTLLEDADALKNKVFQVENVFNKNKNLFMYIGGGIVVAILAFFGFKYYQGEQNKEASAASYNAIFAFESDSLDKALKGQGGNAGLEAVADDYSGTPAGELASLYAGVALAQKKKYNEAIERLKEFSADDQVLQGKAYCLIGDCYLESNKKTDAIEYYKKASEYKPNKFSTPGYMMKLAIAYTENNDKKTAIDTYTQVIEKYGASSEAVIAKKSKARLEAELGL